MEQRQGFRGYLNSPALLASNRSHVKHSYFSGLLVP